MQRGHIAILITIVWASTLSAQAMSPEEMAIKKAIEDSTKYWCQRDFERYADTWLHVPYVYKSVAAPNYHSVLHGWEALAKATQEIFKRSPGVITSEYKNTDYRFRINGNMAYVTYLENGDTSTRLLERHGNQWKLVGLTLVQSRAYQAVARENRIKQLVGHWRAEPQEAVFTPKIAWGDLEGVECSITFDNHVLKRVCVFDWKSQAGRSAHRVEQMIAFAPGTQIRSVLTVEGGQNYGQAMVGTFEESDDGSWIISSYDPDDRSTLRTKQLVSMKDGDIMHTEAEFFGPDGKKEQTLVMDMVRQPSVTLLQAQ